MALSKGQSQSSSVDFLTPIHKALRLMIYDVGGRLQTTDFSDSAQSQIVLNELIFELATDGGLSFLTVTAIGTGTASTLRPLESVVYDAPDALTLMLYVLVGRAIPGNANAAIPIAVRKQTQLRMLFIADSFEDYRLT